MNVRYGDDQHWLEIEEYRNGNTVAIRDQKVEENGRIWNSDYVMNFAAGKMHIQLDRSFTGDANDLDQEFSTPHFLTLLIEEGILKLMATCRLPESQFLLTKITLICWRE